MDQDERGLVMTRHLNIVPDNFQDDKLRSYYDGTMPQGYGIGCDLDNFYVWKPAELTFILGADGAGKTFNRAWYYVCLAEKNGITGDIYTNENQVWSMKMKMISFHAGKHITNLSEGDFYKHKTWVEGHFNFLDQEKIYDLDQLLDIFSSTKKHFALIDPYNSMDIPDGSQNEHLNNKKNLGKMRLFSNQTKKSLDVCMHPATGKARMLHKSGEFEGQPVPLVKADVEGGQIFPNRTDNFLILHRYRTAAWKKSTFIDIAKIKEEETGGQTSNYGDALRLDFSEYKFTVNGVDPMTGDVEVPNQMFEIINPSGGMKNFIESEYPKEIEDSNDDIPF